VPREPVDHARIGRRVVRRRAKGMTASPSRRPSRTPASTRQDSRHEHLADDTGGRAKLVDGSASTSCSPPPRQAPSTTPDTDDAVQDEFGAEPNASAPRSWQTSNPPACWTR
jgi:hypothetical protein